MRDLLLRLDPRQFRLLVTGVLTVLAAAVTVVAVVPPAKAYVAASRAEASLVGAGEDAGQLDALLGERTAEIEALQRRLHGDMANLPAKQVEAYIIGRLQRISWRNDVELVSLQPAAGEKVQIFRETQFRVQLAGHYRDLYRWLWETREELGFVVVREYRLQRRDADDERPMLAAELTLSSYRVEP